MNSMTLRLPSIREHALWRLALKALVVLNLLDAVFTAAYVSAGHATEANPLMEVLLNAGPGLFIAYKLGLVAMGVTYLNNWLHRPLARAGLAAALGVYVAVVANHLGYLGHALS